MNDLPKLDFISCMTKVAQYIQTDILPQGRLSLQANPLTKARYRDSEEMFRSND